MRVVKPRRGVPTSTCLRSYLIYGEIHRRRIFDLLDERVVRYPEIGRVMAIQIAQSQVRIHDLIETFFGRLGRGYPLLFRLLLLLHLHFSIRSNFELESRVHRNDAHASDLIDAVLLNNLGVRVTTAARLDERCLYMYHVYFVKLGAYGCLRTLSKIDRVYAGEAGLVGGVNIFALSSYGALLRLLLMLDPYLWNQFIEVQVRGQHRYIRTVLAHVL